MKNKFGFVIKLFTLLITILFIIFIIYLFKATIFYSNNNLIDFIESYGICAPFIFVIIQIIQVVFPIIPGGLSCLIVL